MYSALAGKNITDTNYTGTPGFFRKIIDHMKVKELREEVLLRQLSTAYGSAAETGNDILERLLDPFLDSISGNVESVDVVTIYT